jgi:hypothetical protein
LGASLAAQVARVLPSAWTAMSFQPVEALIGAMVIPAPDFVILIHLVVPGLVLVTMTVMNVTTSMGWEV